jgi:hypothetical protein
MTRVQTDSFALSELRALLSAPRVPQSLHPGLSSFAPSAFSNVPGAQDVPARSLQSAERPWCILQRKKKTGGRAVCIKISLLIDQPPFGRPRAGSGMNGVADRSQ